MRGPCEIQLNWTTTKVPCWQTDCEAFRRVGHPFELHDVTTAAHEEFVETFCAHYDCHVMRAGTTVTFRPPFVLANDDHGCRAEMPMTN